MTPRPDSDRKMKKTCSNCVSRFLIADDLPDYWMPLPEPPDSRPSED